MVNIDSLTMAHYTPAHDALLHSRKTPPEALRIVIFMWYEVE
jgi:hypothetical protein